MDADRPQRVLTELRAFLGADPVPPRDDPQKQVVELFHRVAASVPAYRKWQCCVAGRRSRRLNQSPRGRAHARPRAARGRPA